MVSGSINTANPGSESFWSQLTPLQVPLTATDDYGGAVPSVAVKIASNGTHILMEATYSDPSMSNSRVSGGPTANQTQYPGLFFANATVHGFDQFAVWWAMSQTPGPPPCMQVGTNQHGGKSPASLAGTGNVWRWTGVSTDSNGTSFATAKYGDRTGALAGHQSNADDARYQTMTIVDHEIRARLLQMPAGAQFPGFQPDSETGSGN